MFQVSNDLKFGQVMTAVERFDGDQEKLKQRLEKLNKLMEVRDAGLPTKKELHVPAHHRFLRGVCLCSNSMIQCAVDSPRGLACACLSSTDS